MNEEELNIWFEEEKEKLTKGYVKKMDSLLIEDTEEENKKEPRANPEQAKKLMKEYEKKFLKETVSLRKKFDFNILKARAKVMNKARNKERKKTLSGPFVLLWNLIKNGFGLLWSGLKKLPKDTKNLYLIHFGWKMKRARERKKMQRMSTMHPYNLYYTQNIWPLLHFLNTPNRLLIKKTIKFMDMLIALIKSIIKISVKFFGKVVKFLSTFMKSILEKLTKFFSFIKGSVAGIIEFIKKVIRVLKTRYFPEKESKK